MRLNNFRHRRPRDGFVMVAVIGLLAVAMVLFVAWTRNAVSRLQIQRAEHERTQAIWLVESGISRALARLQHNADYQGETWWIDADQLDGLSDAEVRIQIASVVGESEETANQPSHLQITVQADLPPGDSRHVRYSKTFKIPNTYRGTDQ